MIIIATYRRYYPITGISCIHKDKLKAIDMTILDIRHYNDVPNFSDNIILNIPYAYLKRFYLEIPRDKIHIIARDWVELNLGVRFLKRKGIHVNSYELAACKCKNK
ncbi:MULTISPECIES: sulfurtransferase [Bacillus]|uniref:sulfurtransferase n=1 Tax=Bacillus TaxID=1386 RepID=UPI0009B1C507|nr:sulfurtransferase [Bacillus subtilis]RJS53607.1 sulfurtransferase [Bacillus subtilis]UQZ56439.1 sulfurtransferase [Bacillus subtilis]UQZ65184.1 sulfurtransferase [Bacillus subtilis PY79]UQZ69610.1 sulfurtransferase [Bacillus subtilis]WHX52183.1 sulfurtransferase [Bacillus subtilis]